MKILDEMPSVKRSCREERYPWGMWFDGKVRLLEGDKDFDCPPKSMKANIYAAARRHGVEIQVRSLGDDLAIQAS